MEQVQELAQNAGSFGQLFSYLMFAVIVYHLYKQFKDKDILGKLESKLEEIKNKIK